MSGWPSFFSPGEERKGAGYGGGSLGWPIADPEIRRAETRHPSRLGRAPAFLPLLLSCALHAAPVGIVACLGLEERRESAGETIMEVEFVVAEAEAQPQPVLEAVPQQPDPASTMPPAIDAAQAPEEKPVELAKREDDAALHLPIEEPEPVTFKAEDKIISVANAAPVPVASTETLAALDDGYSARIARHLAKFKRFPPGLPRKRAGGQVTVGFSLGPDGQVIATHIVRSSEISAIDAEAIAMLRRAEPFPRPAQGRRAPVAFVIPITYRLKD